MDISVYPARKVTNKEISLMVAEKRSFKIKEVEPDFLEDTIETIEKLITSHGFTCIVYAVKRITTLSIDAMSRAGGIVAERTVAAHNIATYNPDYEIVKLSSNTLAITYKK